MRKKLTVLEQVLVEDYAAEGKAISRHEGKVIFIEGAVPGDVVDVRIIKSKADWAEGKVAHFHKYSDQRVEPFCEHFGVCGGCKWQMLPYSKQLEYKQNEVAQHLKRIGKVELPEIRQIMGAFPDRRYRNKLEFTFSNRRYLLPSEIANREKIPAENAVGFHVAGIFDKVIDISTCHLMEEPANAIRNLLRSYAAKKGYSYYDIKYHHGFLRNLMVRICRTGEIMINLCVGEQDNAASRDVINYLVGQVPEITSAFVTVNGKFNDSIYDLTPKLYYGQPFVIEKLGEFRFKVGPKSFFQTNTFQGERLYQVTSDFAELTGKETVYDLYCGTGSIGIFLSGKAAKIVGVETIAE
ncbi:MAG: 23S rRNA (uracil(1939)-C(5))-methyltransferase RlmD, partial [Chitinophagaceae bacterium]